MPKIADEPLEAIQLRLFKRDLDFLRTLFKDSVGVNKVIRTLVRSYVTQAQARANAAIDKIDLKELTGE